jgi:hypothetical protein
MMMIQIIRPTNRWTRAAGAKHMPARYRRRFWLGAAEDALIRAAASTQPLARPHSNRSEDQHNWEDDDEVRDQLVRTSAGFAHGV